MLRCCNGCILKPSEKEILQERENMFYEKIQSSDDSVFKELSNFTPKYYGTVEFNIMKKRKIFNMPLLYFFISLYNKKILIMKY